MSKMFCYAPLQPDTGARSANRQYIFSCHASDDGHHLSLVPPMKEALTLPLNCAILQPFLYLNILNDEFLNNTFRRMLVIL